MHLLNKNVIRIKMINKVHSKFILILISAFCANYSDANSSDSSTDYSLPTYILPTLTVQGQEIANLRPASTYQSMVSNLDFDPRIDFQSRNMAEAQGDINIRGGIFEGTGIQVGAVTLIDPQTGHYSTELPIAPEMLTNPKVLTGTNNALRGFNSTSGTLSYQWSKMIEGSSLTIGGGQNALNFQRIHFATTHNFTDSAEWIYGTELEYSRSESDGTIKNGDHDFSRFATRFQIIGPDSQIDFFVGAQDKYLGWPGMYTATKYINPIEYEDIKTQLLIANYFKAYSEKSFVQVTAAHRINKDHYDLNAIKRNTQPTDEGHIVDYEGDQDTRVSSLGFHIFNAYNTKMGINFTGQIIKDYWRKSDAYNIPFTDNSRYQSKFSIAPEHIFKKSNQDSLKLTYGLSLESTSDELASESSFFGNIQWEKKQSDNSFKNAYISFSETSLVPGYTAIGQHKSSQFKSDSSLGREISNIFELGGTISEKSLKINGTIFYRIDEDLVDWIYSYYKYDGDKESQTYDTWIYSNDNIESRAASSVDMKTFGVELLASKKWDKLETIVSYNFLDKNDVVYNNRNPYIEGSYYALNYAKHRFTLGLIWEPINWMKVRVDNEWRDQLKNLLRKSDNKALFTHLSVSISPPRNNDIELFVSLDNLWDDNYEEMPGTPGKGRQASCGATFKW